MSAARSVLVMTDRYDPTADLVVEELNRRDAPVFRFDTSEFPTALTVSAELTGKQWRGRARTARRSLDLDDISGVYYRRPTAFAFPDGMSVEERRWANVQARLGFGGLLASLEPWLNHPHRIGYAEYKPVQLRTAVAAGLLVPRTLVTNEPDTARAFVSEVGEAICKPFSGTTAVTDTEGPHQVFATRVTPEQAGDPSVAHSMHLFQQWVPKDYEVRLTVVDDQFFAARIDARTAAATVDWRADYHALDYTAVTTPKFVRTRVTELLRRLGLRFGAMDFVVAPDGEWWFLECNPNGQWAWIETETVMPIAAALADALEGRTTL
ncbi:MAG: ATP-grasp ribosomal peptide maturase [Pseudonocardia sp.]